MRHTRQLREMGPEDALIDAPVEDGRMAHLVGKQRPAIKRQQGFRLPEMLEEIVRNVVPLPVVEIHPAECPPAGVGRPDRMLHRDPCPFADPGADFRPQDVVASLLVIALEDAREIAVMLMLGLSVDPVVRASHE